jgi:hypothetical protein
MLNTRDTRVMEMQFLSSTCAPMDEGDRPQNCSVEEQGQRGAETAPKSVPSDLGPKEVPHANMEGE